MTAETIVQPARGGAPTPLLRGLLTLARLYVACLVAAPLSMFVTIIMGDLYQGLPNPFEDLWALMFWSSFLFAGVLILGIPIAFTTFLFVRNFWPRLTILIVAGFVVNFLLFGALLAHPLGGLMAAPAGAITATACCLLNLREIGRADPKFA